MNILKIKKPFLITEAIAKSSSSCIQNLSKFIHSLSLDVLRVSLYQLSKRIMQDIPWTDHWSLYWNAKWHQWSSRSALYFRFTEFRFKINLGSFGPLMWLNISNWVTYPTFCGWDSMLLKRLFFTISVISQKFYSYY